MSIDERGRGACLLDFDELEKCRYKGIRNGNWHKLRVADKVFYKAAMWFARIGGRIVSSRLATSLRAIVDKLMTAVGNKIMRIGIERVKRMRAIFEEKGVFKWAGKLRNWIEDPIYVFWLGLNSQSPYIS